MSDSYKGECFCGAVKLEATGSPKVTGYCHCSSCCSWSAGPVNAFTLWDPESVKVAQGQEFLGKFVKTELRTTILHKMWRPPHDHHPPFGLVDVYAATIPDLKFAPQVHVNYSEAALLMRDGLPKFKDFLRNFGGSGQTVPEYGHAP